VAAAVEGVDFRLLVFGKRHFSGTANHLQLIAD
jgi:hypothetical protein